MQIEKQGDAHKCVLMSNTVPFCRALLMRRAQYRHKYLNQLHKP